MNFLSFGRLTRFKFAEWHRDFDGEMFCKPQDHKYYSSISRYLCSLILFISIRHSTEASRNKRSRSKENRSRHEKRSDADQTFVMDQKIVNRVSHNKSRSRHERTHCCCRPKHILVSRFHCCTVNSIVFVGTKVLPIPLNSNCFISHVLMMRISWQCEVRFTGSTWKL